jgi:hypothetical protein
MAEEADPNKKTKPLTYAGTDSSLCRLPLTWCDV